MKNCAVDTTKCKVKADFSYKVDSCTVWFSDLSTGANTATGIVKRYWRFGDGDTSSQPNPSHVYKKAGSYEVCLMVVGQNGQSKCEDKVCKRISVKNCAGDTTKCKVKADFGYKVDSCTVWFNDLSTGATGTGVIKHYWRFGDGDTSSQPNPIHVYKKAGSYEVCLVVVGQNGQSKCEDKVCKKVSVKNCGPLPIHCGKAFFTFAADSCTVTFKDGSKPGTGITLVGWNWSFGDGSSDSTQNPLHVYKKGGAYKVCLTITGKNAQGQTCKETYCQEVRVKNCGNSGSDCGLKPYFGFNVDSCTVSFYDSSKTANGYTISNWYWSFSNGDTSTAKNPVHTFKGPGKHRVCLTVVGTNGTDKCKETYCAIVVVSNCKKKFMPDPLEGTGANREVKFHVYPNPAQHSANITFDLDKSGQVSVQVTDIQGRVVATLHNGYMAGGYHQLIWKASGEVPAGLYLITVKTDTSADQKTLMLQK